MSFDDEVDLNIIILWFLFMLDKEGHGGYFILVVIIFFVFLIFFGGFFGVGGEEKEGEE